MPQITVLSYPFHVAKSLIRWGDCSLITRRIGCLRARIHVSVGRTKHTLSTKLTIELSTNKLLQKTWGNCKQAEWTKIFTLQLRNMGNISGSNQSKQLLKNITVVLSYTAKYSST